MAYTEFCCRSGGSNLNAGTRTGNSTVPGTTASFTYASGTWVAATGVFTVASGNPSTDGVAVGDFASVYPDGSTVAVFIGRVTARDATTITVSLTIKSGTAPTNGTNNRTLKIGGAWAGPSGAVSFPYNFISDTLLASGSTVNRVNFKNDITYSITSAITHGNNATRFQGFTSTYEDGGKCIIDGGTSGVSFILLTYSGNVCEWWDTIFQNNGASGSATGVKVSGHRSQWVRCVFANVRGNGWDDSGAGTGAKLIECEAYGCNQSNTSNSGGMAMTGGSGHSFTRCISHDNTGNAAVGFRVSVNSPCIFNECIADSNGSDGFSVNTQVLQLTRCDSYNNGGSGLAITNGSSPMCFIASSNFIKNTAYGIQSTTGSSFYGMISNCGFGSGTQANGSGTINSSGNECTQISNITYAANVTPWVDPANGDFRINLTAAKSAGRGTFTQTAASYAGSVGYPDIGSNQSRSGGFALVGNQGPAYGG